MRGSRRSPAPRQYFQWFRHGPWGAFLVVFLLSTLLAVFVLFMQRKWRDRGQRAVVIVHDAVDVVRKPLTVVVIDPETPRLTIMPLAPERSISPLLGYGNYQTQALVGLTQLEKLRWEFLMGSLSLELGTAIDGILWTDLSEVSDQGDIRSIVLSSVANQKATTLAYWDRWRLLAMVESIPDYKVDVSFPADADEAALEKWAARTIQDSQIRSSGMTIAIQNASGIQGMAARYSRLLRIMGYDVRNIETVEVQGESQLVVRSTLDESSWEVQRVQAAVPYLRTKKDDALPEKLRSEMVVVLGEDMREQLSLRQ